MRYIRQRQISEMNVIPYIDVMLVLFVIFLVTIPFSIQGVEIDLPDTNAKPIADPDPVARVIVTINNQGELFISGVNGTDNSDPMLAISAPELSEKLGNILRSNPGTQVLIRGDSKTEYGKVLNLMVSIQNLNAKSINLVTDPPEVTQ